MSDEARQAYLRRTMIPPATHERLMAGLRGSIRARPGLRAAAARVTSADPDVLVRLRSRLDARRPPRRRFGVGIGLVLAAAAVVLVGFWSRRDGPLDPSAPIDHVKLAFDGEGKVGGTRRAPVVSWDEGTLSVEVTPHQGVDLTVVTPEATARVVGTVFRVERSHHATVVAVTEGTVAVTCTGEPETGVHAGEQRACLPNDAATLLLRAAELSRAGTDSGVRLETLNRGVERAAPGSAVRAELLAHRARAFTEAGATDDALLSAEAYLDTGETPRRAELLTFVARTRYDREACAAIAVLERAVAELPPGPEAVLLAGCLVDRDPDRARTLLQDLSWADDAWQDTARRLVSRASR